MPDTTPNTTTKLANLINPEVMADMISAKIESAIVVTPFARIDNTLQGQPGSTVTVPRYDYIGDAVDVGEGDEVTPVILSASKASYTIKKAMQAVSLTDEAILSGYGNPVGETNTQLANSIASKVDSDAISALLSAAELKDEDERTTNLFTANDIISYEGIVDAIDMFNEEMNTTKVMFVHPHQVSQLRKDEDFISADKYSGDVIMSGEIGQIANTRIIASRRVPLASGYYSCPIVKIETDERTEDEVPALTIYLKRDTNVETERDTLKRKTHISVDRCYVAALTNSAKVIVARFKDSASG